MKPSQALLDMTQASAAGNLDAVRTLLEAHPEVETVQPFHSGSTWLHSAAGSGNFDLVEFWLQRGWDVNTNAPDCPPDEGTFTALHCAKDAAMTRHLLSRGAFVNACHRELGTPLHYAVGNAVEPSQKGRRREGGADMEQIRALLEAGADPSLMKEEHDGHTPLTWAIFLGRKTAAQFLRDAGAPEQGRRPFGERPKIDTLDLRNDYQVVYEYVAKRVSEFNPAAHNGLGGPGHVKMILLGFDCANSGWAVLVFDTRPNAASDMEWTLDIEGNELKMPQWYQAALTNGAQPITQVMPDGSQSVLPAGSDLVTPIGNMLATLLLQADADGLFAYLAKAPDCQFSVAGFNGDYLWPE